MNERTNHVYKALLLTGFSGIRIKVYTYKELKKAANNFSPDNKINHGAFGCVYKVTSPATFKYLFSSLLFYFLI